MVCQWLRDFAQCGVSGAEELGQNEDYWGGGGSTYICIQSMGQSLLLPRMCICEGVKQ